MHVPDGFIDLPTSAVSAVVSIVAVGAAIRHLRGNRGSHWPLRAGLTAAFVFATQMVNYPVAHGTSGHLIGAALAAAILGPAGAIVVMTTVLVVQAVLFADGGITALGVNTLLMAVVAVLVAHGVQSFVAGRIARPGRGAIVGSVAGALTSVPAAALTFAALYLVGGATPVHGGALAGTIVAVHAVIGLGEALITGLCVGAAVSLRPDLVALASGDEPVARPAVGLRGFAWGALALTLGIAGGASVLASNSPDGLEWSAERLGFAGAAQDSVVAGTPFADYAFAGMGGLGTSAAGLVGVALTLAVAMCAAALIGRNQRSISAA